MSQRSNNNIKNLGILAGIVLSVFALGFATGQLPLVIVIFKAIILMLFAITILVVVHELGHFWAARAFGIRVEIFSIGFPPRIFSFKKGDTEYQIGATPLGGYVKIAGMIDESMDKSVIERERMREEADRKGEPNPFAPRPWEFRSKPVWQRLIVMLGGIFMNVVLGIAIFSGLKYINGESRTPVSEIVGGVIVLEDTTSLGSMIGFQTGDELVSYKGKEFNYIEEYLDAGNLIEDGAYFEVKREGKLLRLDVPPAIQNSFGEDTIAQDLFLYKPTSHLTVMEKKRRLDDGSQINPAAFEAGMKTGDRIIRLDDKEIFWFEDIKEHLDGKANSTILTHYVRGTDTLSSTVRLDSNGYMGVSPFTERIKFSLQGAVKAGSIQAFSLVSDNAQGFVNIATKKEVKASKSIMGIPQIAWRFVSVWEARGIPGFLWLTATLSMILAFVNILPIPALDGGNVVFLLIEGITRREPSVKVRLIAQQIGMLIILGLMLFVIFNDIIQLAT